MLWRYLPLCYWLRMAEAEGVVQRHLLPPHSPPLPGQGALNDSGITANQCYQAGSDILVACSTLGATTLNAAQDGMVGRDANVSTNSNSDGS